MSAFRAILHKDLRLEARGGESTITLAALALLILVVMVFALNPAGGARDAGTAAGALWVALIFSGMLGATRVLLAERDNGCLRALLISPLDRATLYAAKLVAAAIFMIAAQTAVVLVMVLFFNLDFDIRLLRLGAILALGVLGFAALATLLAAIVGRVRAGEMLLPLLAVPMFVPALIAGVKASGAAIAGESFIALALWLKVLVAFDVLFLSAGYVLFERVIAEE